MMDRADFGSPAGSIAPTFIDGLRSRRRVIIDVTDFVAYMAKSQTVSGIQRVISAIAEQTTDRDEVLFSVWSMGAFRQIAYGAGVRPIDTINAYIEWKRAVRAVRTKRSGLVKRLRMFLPAVAGSRRLLLRRVIFRETDVFFIFGAVWNKTAFLRRVVEEKRRHGIQVVQFVHDLTPLIVPEHFIDNVPEQFSAWLSTMATTADRFIVNSQCTRRDLTRFLIAFGYETKPISVVTLAHEFTPDAGAHRAYKPPKLLSGDVGVIAIPSRVRNAARIPYVLCVGTIESRKNHWTLVRAWTALSLELKTSMPRLVIVGKQGWLKHDFDDIMRATGNVGGLACVVDQPNDHELEFLYRRCRFSVYLSYYEGWGLPVGESLWCGRPVLASSTSAIPEVGGDYVDYADPHSLDDVVTKLRRLIVDDAHLAERVSKIAAMPKRTWADVAADLANAL